jgi:serine/threonine-protein kinase
LAKRFALAQIRQEFALAGLEKKVRIGCLAMDTGAPVTQIGKYPVLGVLGVGGMGVVYRGMDKSVGREVAIKTLTAATDELRQRFQLEARSGVLNHPNIVTVYDFGEQDGMPYIVMEFVPGDSLENLLQAGRQFSLVEKLDIVRQVCLGLGYAHQKGVIHRDIKPANVMVMPDGNIKIVDFGVARLQNQSGHTQVGMVIGTFHYISPERLMGKPADGRSDLWSAGVILYMLLTGRLPFPGEGVDTLQKVIHDPHDPLSTLLSEYPPGLDHVIDRALQKNPFDRYESGEEMAADIEEVNEELKREQVGESLGNVKHLMELEQWPSARYLLLDLQRLNPQNTDVKKLLREVQEKVSRQQKTAQIQQLMGNAEDAVLTQRYNDALGFYTLAAGIDKLNPELTQKIEHVRNLKEKAEQVALLLEQAREARKQSDFSAASELVEKALQLDDRNTDLRNERARIVQEAEKAARQRALSELAEAARGQFAARQYTEAIKNLNSALEIDPTDAETQQLYQTAVERQEEQRRRKIIEQIAAEISDSIAGEDFERALQLIQRAQERLPGEPVLLQLKTEAETRQRNQVATKLVEQTTREVYSLFLTDPQQALTVVQQALEQMPGEPRLISLHDKVIEQLQKASAGERKSFALQQAQAAIDTRQFAQAVQILEAAGIEFGDFPEIASLLAYAQEQKRKDDISRAVADAIREARSLITDGDLESAVALLKPVALETGDASIDQLLRQATATLVEVNRRVDALLSRAQATSETDIEQALQLLSSQPPEIQRQPRMREFRARLDAIKDQERLTVEAILNAEDALQKRDLRNGLTGLESVRSTYGDSPRVTTAIAEYKSRRTQIANQALTAAMESANQAVQQGDPRRAAEELAKVADVAGFADPALQASLKRSTKEVAKSSPKKQQAKPMAAPASAKTGLPRALVFGGVGVVVLGGAVAAFFLLRPAPVVSMGALELNATPFAEVVSVTSDKGNAIPLPAGDHWTPLRLDDLPTGKYTVSFKGPDGNTQSQQCDVAQTAQVCGVELKPIDDSVIDQIIGGTK